MPQAAFIYSLLPLREVKLQPEEDLSETGMQNCWTSVLRSTIKFNDTDSRMFQVICQKNTNVALYLLTDSCDRPEQGYETLQYLSQKLAKAAHILFSTVI